jgi:hypothetical protein
VISIIVLLISKQAAELSDQLFDLFIDVLDIFAIAFILSFFILLLIGFFVLRAKLIIDLAFLLAFLLDQQLLYRGDGARNGLFVLKDAVEFGV